MKFLTNLDLSQNEIQNAVIQPLAAAPANPKLGQIYYNSSDSLLYQYDGAQWKPVGKGYELPAATKTALGGIKVGGRLSVAADGTLSADKQTDNNLTERIYDRDCSHLTCTQSSNKICVYQVVDGIYHHTEHGRDSH